MAAPTLTGVPILKGSLNPKLLEAKANLKRVFDFELKSRTSLIPTLFHVDSSTRAYEEQISMGGITDFTQIGETTAITYQGMSNGYVSRWTHLKYANGVSHSLEAIEDEQHGVLKRKSELLAESAWSTREQLAASFFNNAFTRVWNATEGQYFCDSDHPLDPRATYNSGTTFSNTLTDPLDIEPLQEVIVLAQRLPSPMGRPLNYTPKYLLVPPALQFLAKQILQSSGEYDSPNNSINTIRNAMQVLVWPYLTSSTVWFVICDRHELYWYNRRPFTHDTEEDFDTEILKEKATFRCSNGAADPRGVFGSTGTG